MQLCESGLISRAQSPSTRCLNWMSCPRPGRRHLLQCAQGPDWLFPGEWSPALERTHAPVNTLSYLPHFCHLLLRSPKGWPALPPSSYRPSLPMPFLQSRPSPSFVLITSRRGQTLLQLFTDWMILHRVARRGYFFFLRKPRHLGGKGPVSWKSASRKTSP